jgi:hypothetical protein
VLELDRVLDATPDELDRHRIGLKSARQNRLERIASCTERLLARMDVAAGTANASVLMHPAKAPAVVRSSNHVSTAIIDFEERLGIERARQSSETRRWGEAAAEVRDKTLEAGADGFDAAKRFGNKTVGRAKAVKGKLADRTLRRDGMQEEHDAVE